MSQFGVDRQSVHFETECHGCKMSQQTVLSGGRIVWVEMSRGWFVGGRIVNAPDAGEQEVSMSAAEQ